MLNSMRSFAGSWVAKAFLFILVLSFALWGINGVFSGFSPRSVLEVGDQEIPLARFQIEFEQQRRDFSRRLGQDVTLAEARTKYNLDRLVLGRLIGVAALNQAADDLNLKVSDERVATDIRSDPAFHGPFGKFDRQVFDQILYRNGLTEGLVIEDRRESLIRDQILTSVEAGATGPDLMVNAIADYRLEQRQLAYMILPPEAAGEIEDPGDETVESYYQQNAARFTRPETRTVSVMVLSAADVAATIEVSEADIADAFAQRRDQYDTPEKRVVEQIPFPTYEDAVDAAQRLQTGGVTFGQVASEQGLTTDAISLGEVTRNDLISPEIADAAFSLELNKISAPIEGPLGTVLLRVTQITPGRQSTLDEVKDQIRRDLARERALNEMFEIQNQIEDARAGGATLQDVAQRFNLKVHRLEDITADGRKPDGKSPALVEGLPPATDIAEIAFQNDVGIEISPEETEDGGYYWVNVEAVTPSEVKPLETVRGEVLDLWKQEMRKERLLDLAQKLVDRGNGGESFEAIAADLSRAVLTSPPIRRNMTNETFSRFAVANAFAVPVGQFTFGPVGYGESLVIMQVKSADVAQGEDREKTVKQIRDQINATMGDDWIAAYVNGLRDEYGVEVNNAALDLIFGGSDSASF